LRIFESEVNILAIDGFRPCDATSAQVEMFHIARRFWGRRFVRWCLGL